MHEMKKTAWELTHDGRRLRVVLRGGKGNVIDSTMAVELLGILRSNGRGPHLRCATIEAEGPHFSFGASVPEHSPEQAPALISALDGLVLALVHAPVPVVASVRGACLGGGLELVLPCHRIVVSPTAKLGLPEVTLGMFAPAGSALLLERVPRGTAIDMLVTGRSLDAAEAKAAGLADEIADDPEAAATAWFEKNLLPLSASAIRYAVRGARVSYAARVDLAMSRLERIFLDETMGTKDANEGVDSFLGKRKPNWVDA